MLIAQPKSPAGRFLTSLTVLVSISVSALAGNPGDTHVNATRNDDVVIVDFGAKTVSVNGAVRSFEYPANGPFLPIDKAVCFDGRDGFDSITFYAPLSSSRNSIEIAGDVATSSIWRLADARFENFEEILYIPYSPESDRLFLVDTEGDDYCEIGSSYSQVSTASIDFIYAGEPHFASAIGRGLDGDMDEVVLRDSGKDDLLTVEGNALRLYHDWTGASGPQRVVDGFDRVRVIANSGGTDQATIWDTDGIDVLRVRGSFAQWQSQGSDIRLLGFEELFATSNQGFSDPEDRRDFDKNGVRDWRDGQFAYDMRARVDQVVIEDVPAQFDAQTGEIQTDDPKGVVVSTPTYVSSTGDGYRNVVRGFPLSTYATNGINSRMFLYEDYDAKDPKANPDHFYHQRGLLILDDEGSPARPNHLKLISRIADGDPMRALAEAFWLRGGGSRQLPPTAVISANGFYSEGATEVNGSLVPPTSAETRGYDWITIKQNGFCQITVKDSSGDDEFRVSPNDLKASYPLRIGSTIKRVDLFGTDRNAIVFQADVQSTSGNDRLIMSGLDNDGVRHDLVVDGRDREVAFEESERADVPQHRASGFAEVTVRSANVVRYVDSPGDDRLNIGYGIIEGFADDFFFKLSDPKRFRSSGARGGVNEAIFQTQYRSVLVGLSPKRWDTIE